MNNSKRQKALFSALVRLVIGIAALVGYFVKVSAGDPISKWLMMCMFGLLLMFWGIMDIVNLRKGRKQ